MADVYEIPPWQQGATPEATPADSAPLSDNTLPPWQQPGYKPAPAAVAAPAPAKAPESSFGYSAGVLAGFNPPVSETDQYVANARAGLARIPGTIVGLPHSLGAIGDWIGSKFGASADPGFITRHTYSPDEITAGLQKADADINPMFGLPAPQPLHKAQTYWGNVGQDALASAPLAAVGGGGAGALALREAANLFGTGGVEAAKTLFPNSPGAQLVAGLLASFIPGAATSGLSTAANTTKNLLATKGAVENAATRNLLNASGETAGDLTTAIDAGTPNWQFAGQATQPKPTTATVTQNPGLLDYTYRDQAKAPTPYRENAAETNAAQREAVANATPDIQPQLTANQTILTGQLGNLPIGVTAQDAGSTFRLGLQNVYDQRLQARQTLGNSVFDALDTSPAQINLRPVMDYATEQAAKNAGEVGAAYKAAGNQFKSGTGITLDTAPFANSTLKGLSDLAGSYPPGSAGQRAVLDVKAQAENAIFNQEPAIAGARQAYAAASQPLDVFNKTHTPGPIANAVETTRFGGYSTPNDAVVSQFLKGTAAPDAIDKLNSVFPDVKAATQSLQDYIASQVQARAVTNGRVDANALQNVLAPYQGVLNKLPFAGIKKQFADLNSAQAAVDQLAGRQKMFDTFQNELGLGKTDINGQPFYSAAKFDAFVKKNQGELVSAYGQDGANTINQVNSQLRQIAQEANSRVPGQSGTAQASHGSGGSVARYIIGEAIGGGLGDLAGIMAAPAHGTLTGLGFAAVGHLAGAAVPYLQQRFAGKVDEITRQALLDPAFAKSLLVKYNPKMPTSAGTKAMNYVRNSLTGNLAPATNVAQ